MVFVRMVFLAVGFVWIKFHSVVCIQMIGRFCVGTCFMLSISPWNCFSCLFNSARKSFPLRISAVKMPKSPVENFNFYALADDLNRNDNFLFMHLMLNGFNRSVYVWFGCSWHFYLTFFLFWLCLVVLSRYQSAKPFLFFSVIYILLEILFN